MTNSFDPGDPSTWAYWMTLEQVAAVLQVHLNTVRGYLKGQKPRLTSRNVAIGSERAVLRILKDDVLTLANFPDHLERGGDKDNDQRVEDGSQGP